MSVKPILERLLAERILLFDGAMGTMIQSYRFDEAAFRGEAYADHSSDLKGCNDLLSVTRPRIIEEIHLAYLEAGADIIETNSFNATAVSLADYGLEKHAFAINKAAAETARCAADSMTARTPERPRFVAGSIGPTNKTASLSPDVNDPALRGVTFEELEAAYYEQVEGLMAGGVDLLMPETTFDTLNLKAALFAIERWFATNGKRVPVIASLTITDRSGRTLSGQTVEAAWISIAHTAPFAVGLNCALGAEEMRPHVEELAHLAPCYIHCYPNAGLPNEFGEYDQSPDEMAAIVSEFAAAGWLNMVGGCCGTTPDHIRAIAEAVASQGVHRLTVGDSRTRLSGMEPFVIRPDSNFTMIGERTNVAGSRRFARLIKAGDFETALEVARDQVEGGANILDVNMDEGLLDSEAVMTTFLNLVAAEPEIARIPIMIDSSKFSVLEAGLRCIQGKGVVNSISLKEGQEIFVRQARLVRRYGAAVVVMAFDEEGQAVTSARKVEILSRAYGILTEQVGFPPEDIIFDPNILTVATGMEEHDRYAIEFIEATRELKRRFPLSKVSGGVSNVSFSFRGNDKVREAIHSAFLYHAIEAGLDMGIVNAGQLEVYDDIPKELLTHVEDVLLARRPDATERLVTYAETVSGKKKTRVKDDAWRQTSLEERLSHALVRGIVDHLETDLGEALESYGGALAIIEGPLMDGMNVVGDLFGAGKMFLPQVVKSARVMKKAVLFLDPYMERTERRAQAKILMATVKGDVHDIGKNIVGVVLACNNYDIVDLGVMVPAEKILKAAQEEQVDLIGLSGLITPSLDEMVHVASEMNRLKMTTPLLIGGATTSKKHTAVKIAPAYRETSVHVLDASRAVEVVGRLIGKEKVQFQEEIRDTQRALLEAFENRVAAPLLSLAKARAQALATDWSSLRPPEPAFTGSRTLNNVPLDEIVPYIDWTPFFHAWELRGSYPRILNDPKYGTAASELFDNAQAMLERIVKDGTLTANGVYGFFPAGSTGDDIRVFVDDERADELALFHTLRQQTGRKDRPRLALADYVAPVDAPCKDWIGAFAVTTGIGTDDLAAGYEADQDDYNAIMVKSLADRLAEAFAEMLHLRVRREWGYEPAGEPAIDDLFHERYRGIRPAPGYPACPDHTEKLTIWRLLDVEAATGIRLTESYAMWPAASVSGLYFSHPESKYFSVGKIDRDQVASYAERKGLTVAAVERWLGPNLGYSS